MGKEVATVGIMELIKVGRRGQMVLPSRVRKAMNVNEGDTLLVEVQGEAGEEAMVKIVRQRSFRDFCGIVAPVIGATSTAEAEAAEAQAVNDVVHSP